LLRQLLQVHPIRIPGLMYKGLDIFQNEAVSIHEYFHGLNMDADLQNELPNVSGFLELVDVSDGAIIDRYYIKIVAVPEYPLRFPHVYETGGRIPENIDWHVFPNDGRCCLATIPEEILTCKKGVNLPGFIEKIVTSYFFNQRYREDHGYFLKERSHGDKGNVEFFTEIFKTDDLLSIANGLSFIKQHKEPNRVSNCFCGSGQKFRKCHQEAFRTLSAFSDQELDLLNQMIMKYHWCQNKCLL